MKKNVLFLFGLFAPMFAQAQTHDTIRIKDDKSLYPEAASYSVLTDKEFFHALVLLPFILTIIFAIYKAQQSEKNPISEKVYSNMMTLTLTIGSLMIFIIAGHNSEQLQTPFGIIGTLVAYLLGQQSKTSKIE